MEINVKFIELSGGDSDMSSNEKDVEKNKGTLEEV